MLARYNPANWPVDWSEALLTLATVTLALLVAYTLFRALFAIACRIALRSDTAIDEMVLEKIRHPAKWAFLSIAVTVIAQNDPELAFLWEPLAVFVRPALLGWIVYTIVQAFAAAMEHRLGRSHDPVAVRSRRTRIAIFSRAATFAIIVITAGLVLLGIPTVRDVGTTLLASAGLAALAIGAAAQPALKSLIAGLQLAITEPLRIGDLVKVDGEAGRVEEIRMSFVTVRTWDERLLIVPTVRFLDETFENWSRSSERLSGPVYLHLDPATDVGPIRAEFERFAARHPLSDGRNMDLVMSEAYPESVELRLTVSAATIGDLWALRCAVREHMLAWLRREMPGALIRHRLEVEAANARAVK